MRFSCADLPADKKPSFRTPAIIARAAHDLFLPRLTDFVGFKSVSVHNIFETAFLYPLPRSAHRHTTALFCYLVAVFERIDHAFVFALRAVHAGQITRQCIYHIDLTLTVVIKRAYRRTFHTD